MHHIFMALAQAASGGGGAPAGGGAGQPPGGCAGGGLSSMIPLLLMFVIFYFMLIRPQQKKAKEHQNFLSALKKGDQVITRGGVVGRITGVTDNMVTLEIQEKVRVRVLKSYIDGTHKDASAPADKAEKKDKEAATPASS